MSWRGLGLASIAFATLALQLGAAAGDSACGDCKPGGFRAPLLYFHLVNVSAADCCARCAANATCAFSIWQPRPTATPVGNCFFSPASASGWHTGGETTTCRSSRAPPWPPPPPPPLPPPLPLWPAPNAETGTVSAGPVAAVASKSFAVRCADSSRGCPSASALAWYERRIRADGSSAAGAVAINCSVVDSVTVEVTSSGILGMAVGTDESYLLACSAQQCTVSANSTVGAVRGLETLAHLAHAQHIPQPLRLFDEPRFPYRGLLIDSARHFLPVHSVQRVLDAMSMTKLNVLHWHLSDTTSFPVQSEAFPQLSRLGAYHPSLVYTKQDLTALVAYAAQRGIRVIPEFDLPGHSCFHKSMPQLVAQCAGALDPTLDATYDFLRTFLKEMGGVFTDQYLALGGDEVSFGGCAREKKAWLAAHNMTARQLLPYFWRRVSAEVSEALTGSSSVAHATSHSPIELGSSCCQVCESWLMRLHFVRVVHNYADCTLYQVMPTLKRTLYVWGTTNLTNLDPDVTPEGTVFNLYTALDASLDITAKRGVPGVLSAPYYLDQTQSYRESARYNPQGYRHCGDSVHFRGFSWTVGPMIP